jgi:hypothetical protein
MVLGYGYWAFQVSRTETGLLLGLYAALFLAYTYVIRSPLSSSTTTHWHGWLVTALVVRLIGLWAIPSLSDDFYRFVWDGRLLVAGYNPYLYLPKALPAGLDRTTAHLPAELFHSLNSPSYYTIYPPLLQGWFGVVASLTDDLRWSAFGLRLPILLAELATVYYLYRLMLVEGWSAQQSRRGVLVYALNPLVISELTGNLHYEGLLIPLLLGSVFYATRRLLTPSALLLAGAIGVKLLPLIYFPALARPLSWPRRLRYGFVVAAGVLIPFLFFVESGFFLHFGKSLQLYFQQFEFNAGLYYLLRGVGQWLLGFNPIAYVGPLLALTSAAGMLSLSSDSRLPLSLRERVLLVGAVYLLCATTVHPWYLTPLLALGVGTRFRFQLVWTSVAILSYAAYGHDPVRENPWLLLIEYGLVVGVLWLDLRRLVRQ